MKSIHNNDEIRSNGVDTFYKDYSNNHLSNNNKGNNYYSMCGSYNDPRENNNMENHKLLPNSMMENL